MQVPPFYCQNWHFSKCITNTRASQPCNFSSSLLAISDKVALAKKNGKMIGLSPVFDYIYRSSKLEHMSLYEWIQRCQCKKILKKKVSKERENIEHDDLSADPDVSIISNASDNILENESFKTTGAPNISLLPKNMCAFPEEHLLAASHASYVNFKNVENVVPNFMGVTLPRCDQGDREYYASTMLTLFKPWRSGLHLKTESETWDESFTKYQFNESQIRIIQNFNI